MARRILLLVTDLEIGGTPTVVRELATRLISPEIDIEVACLAPWGPVADQIRGRGIEVTALGAQSSTDFSVFKKLIKLIDDRQYDTVFSFLVHANAASAVVSLVRDHVRYIQSIQTTQPYPQWHWWVQWLAQQRSEQVVVPSPSAAQVARTWAGVSDEKLTVIPNAVELNDFRDVREGQSARPRRPRPWQIGFIGRLDPIKRVPDLIRAVAMLGHDAHLHIYGDGGERPEIEAEIARLRLADRVTMHGTIARPQDALERIDLLALPSQAEGFGLVLIEAMAAGVPVVATEAPGIRDVVERGQSGMLVRVGSAGEMALAIIAVMENDALRNRLIEGGLTTVISRYTWERVLPHYRTLLDPLRTVEDGGLVD